MKALWLIISLVAVVIIVSSTELWKNHQSSVNNYAALWAGLTFASVAFLHWLLVRYVVSDGLYPSADPERLRLAAEQGYNRSFFRGTTGFGYVLVAFYCARVLLGPRASAGPLPSPLPTGDLFVGALLLFLGVMARARGIIVSLLEARAESDLPLANQWLQRASGR